jgi:hypothetical protein
MSELKKGDRVTVDWGDERPPFAGTITGEGRTGHWWMVLRDGRKHPIGCHKNFCKPESSGAVGEQSKP